MQPYPTCRWIQPPVGCAVCGPLIVLALQLEIRSALGTIGLILNSAQTKVLTSEPDAPVDLTRKGGWWWNVFVVMDFINGWDVWCRLNRRIITSGAV